MRSTKLLATAALVALASYGLTANVHAAPKPAKHPPATHPAPTTAPVKHPSTKPHGPPPTTAPHKPPATAPAHPHGPKPLPPLDYNDDEVSQ